jgi:succinate dehydrogenase / fumarate reductase membrane anchor subunit
MELSFENHHVVAIVVFMVALLYHAWVGMRNITMDYVKPLAIRLPLQGAIIAALYFLPYTPDVVLWLPRMFGYSG